MSDTVLLFSLSELALCVAYHPQQYQIVLHYRANDGHEKTIVPPAFPLDGDNCRVEDEIIYWPILISDEVQGCVALPCKNWSALDELDKDKLIRIGNQLLTRYCHHRLSKNECKQHQLSQQALLHADESISRWRSDTGWRHLNPTITERLGYKPNSHRHSLVGNSTVLNPENRQYLQEQWQHCQHSGKSTNFQFQIADHGGTVRWFECSLHVVRTNANGTAAEVLALATDITSMKNADKTVAEQTKIEQWMLEKTSYIFNKGSKTATLEVLRELGELFDVSRCFVRSYDHNYKLLYAEWAHPSVTPIGQLLPTIPAGERVDRFDEWLRSGSPIYISDTSQEKLGQKFEDFTRKVDIQSLLVMPITYRSRVTGHLVLHNKHKRQWSELEKRVARVVGDAIGMVIANDSLAKQVNASEQRFRIAMDAAAYALWEIDLTNDSILIGHTYDQMLGIETREASYRFRPISFHTVHPDERVIAEENYHKIKNGLVDEFSHEARHIRSDGSYVWLLTHAKVVSRDKNGRPLRVMGTHADISEIKNSQIDLQIALQETDAIARAKSEFLARMSHEIRTPMNAILGMTNLILQTAMSAKINHHVCDIENAASGLLQTIDDILDFSKIEAGKLNIEYHQFDLYDALTSTVERYSDTCFQKGVKLDLQIDPETPQIVSSDSTRLKQVLANLLSNAIKFTAAGKITVRAKPLKRQASRTWVEITVSDSGIGMNEETVEQLFDPFTQADGSATRRFGGTGLGLAICHRLVNLLGGDINVSSEPGGGSEFRFTVACKSTGAASGALGDIYLPTLSPTIDDDKVLASLQVLLVEDNPINQKVARNIMEKKHIKVIVANNGNEALLIAKGCAPGELDMILMDIEMPLMNGLEATAAIREIDRYSSIPIIAMTAHSGEDRTYLDHGMSDCITKPITPDALYQKLLNSYRRSIS